MLRMTSFTVHKMSWKIRNSWVRDGLSEVLATFIFCLFVYASGAQHVLSGGAAGSVTGRMLAVSVGLMIAVCSTISLSGGSVNPNVSVMFCLLGKVPWKKLPLYIVSELIGAFLAATVTYLAYKDLIGVYDGGVRTAFGENGTAHLFTSFPHPGISWSTGLFDVVAGTALLIFSIAAIIDHKNAGIPKYLIPLALVPMLMGVLLTFGLNTGAAINSALDLSGRLFAFLVYGTDLFSHGTDYYWAWIPPFGGLVGAVLGTLMYQLLAGNHLPEEDWKSSSVNTCELTSSEQSSQKLKNSNQTLDTLDGVKIVTTTLNSS